MRSKLNIAIDRIKLVLAKPIFEELDCFCDKDIHYDILPEEQNDHLYKLMEIDSPAVVDELIRRWISWIAIGGCQLLVDAVAVQVRTNPGAVHPLVTHFAKDLNLTDPQRRAIIRQTFTRDLLPAVYYFIPDLLKGDHDDVNPDNLPALAHKLVRQIIDYLQANPLDDYLRDKLKPRNGINIFEHDLELIISQVNSELLPFSSPSEKASQAPSGDHE